MALKEEEEEIGQRLLHHVSSAREELIIVAPFVKKDVFARLVDRIGKGVTLNVVTRWRPEEVRAGVSDPEILTLLAARPRSTLCLRPNLHAKYFRSDTAVMIGSANLTAAALGWTQDSNLEVLEVVELGGAWVARFERELLSGAVVATPELRDAVLAAAEKLPDVVTTEAMPLEVEEAVRGEEEAQAVWLPSLRNPEELFECYMGDYDRMSTAALGSARRDLRHLRIPSGLSKEAFIDYVGALLRQERLISEVDEFVVERRRFGEVAQLISRNTGRTAEQGDLAWQALMRWLLYYLPERYVSDVPRHSELFGRRSTVPVTD